MKEKEWRQAFTKFKTKKGARYSLEALLKRVSQGRECKSNKSFGRSL